MSLIRELLKQIAGLLLVCSLSIATHARAGTFDGSASLRTLFPPSELEGLSLVLPPDRAITWTVRVPDNAGPHGVLVFVSPDSSAALARGWAQTLDQHQLIWVAAQGFGNSIPVTQRTLAALMGLAWVQQHYTVDARRIYVAGVSGGGRVASMTITEFPQLFTGALYMVGVNFWRSEAAINLPLIRQKRFVFLTGERDFNRLETRQIYRKYRAAGVEQALLLDLPGFGHGYPNASQLDTALRFLDQPQDASAR